MKRFLLALGVALAVVGTLVWWRGHQKAARDAAKDAQKTAEVPVLIARAVTADVPVYVDGIGTVQALNTVSIKPMVDGPLMSVRFHEGEDVKAGEVLAQIDPRTYQAAYDQAVAKKAQDEANLKNDQLNLQRFQTLAKQQFETQQNLDTQQALVDQVTAQLKGDQAAIDNAQTNLGYTSIKAPISGRMGFRLVDPGNIVHAADTTGIVTIAQLQPIAVQFTEPEEQLLAIDKAFNAGGVPVEALTSDGSRTLSQGRLVVMDNSVNQATGTISLKARFDNKDNALWPGLSVNTRMLIDTRKQVIVVPQDGVQHGPSGLFAYVISDNGKVGARPIKVSQSGDANAVVSEGLNVGDRIVVAGQSRLFDGALVDARPAGALAEPMADANSGTKTGSAD